jgi:hypothetical protein
MHGADAGLGHEGTSGQLVERSGIWHAVRAAGNEGEGPTTTAATAAVQRRDAVQRGTEPHPHAATRVVQQRAVHAAAATAVLTPHLAKHVHARLLSSVRRATVTLAPIDARSQHDALLLHLQPGTAGERVGAAGTSGGD